MKSEIKDWSQRLRAFHMESKRMPTYSEMQAIFGLKSKNSVFKRVLALSRAGCVSKDAKGRLLPGALMAPARILGSVAAGFPSPAEEELVDTLSLDEYLISNPQATYLLKVDGDSMIDAGIRPGDLVLVQRALAPRDGDIVIAQVDGEWTMKYFERKGRRVALRAANSRYPAIVPSRELVIAGVVIANVRKYR